MNRPSERCAVELHEALKLDDSKWAELEVIGVQEAYDDDGHRADLVLANCKCGSTLARRKRS